MIETKEIERLENLICGTEEELMLKLQRSMEDVKNGHLIEHNEFMEELRKEFTYL